ncbi:MAG: cytochrome c3 family protein, partial [Desulfuromonadaceae bacterium]
GCHNIHKAKANWRAPGDPGDTAISRPSDHDSLWGDGAGETMQQYATSNGATYRAPFYVGAVITSDPAKHEPDGSVRSIYSNEVQGSITPDYNSFCLSCHQYAVGSKNAINFGVSGDKHGLATAGSAGMQGQRMAPYTTDGTSGTSYDSSTNFALSCLDCHEPHGSNNIYLLRSTVNGTNVNSVVNPIGTGTQTVYFCRGCHTSAPHNSTGQNCLNCHSHGVTSRF